MFDQISLLLSDFYLFRKSTRHTCGYLDLQSTDLHIRVSFTHSHVTLHVPEKNICFRYKNVHTYHRYFQLLMMFEIFPNQSFTFTAIKKVECRVMEKKTKISRKRDVGRDSEWRRKEMVTCDITPCRSLRKVSPFFLQRFTTFTRLSHKEDEFLPRTSRMTRFRVEDRLKPCVCLRVCVSQKRRPNIRSFGLYHLRYRETPTKSDLISFKGENNDCLP